VDEAMPSDVSAASADHGLARRVEAFGARASWSSRAADGN